MKNRTYIRDVRPGVNFSVFGIVQSFMSPKKTAGSDYQMILKIEDESTTDNIVVSLFLGSQESFPSRIVEKQTIIKIENLNIKETGHRTRRLIDRNEGCFFFDVKRDSVEYMPYFRCTSKEYVEGPEDRDALNKIQSHFMRTMPIGPVLLSSVMKEGTVFSMYGYVKDVVKNEKLASLMICDPSTHRELRVRVWERSDSEIPKKDSYIYISGLKAKKVEYASIVADVSKSGSFIWTASVPREVSLLLSAYQILQSKSFLKAVMQRISETETCRSSHSGKNSRHADKAPESAKKAKKSAEDAPSQTGHDLDLSDESFNEYINSTFMEDADFASGEAARAEEGHAGESPNEKESTAAEVLGAGEKKDLIYPVKKAVSISNAFSRLKEKKKGVAACPKGLSLSDVIAGKPCQLSFKETDLIYDELIRLPIKAYHTNLQNGSVSFDKHALLYLDPHAAGKDQIRIQHVAFYKKTAVVFHQAHRSSKQAGQIAGYILFLSSKQPTVHAFLYRNVE
ncbi:uncharacterized protein NEMAJ01_0311 [Nematocida major]|uniref:uncharacterized protein n=1 Tax=Nematocida major TaxID=1912982 RepID=UPI00200746B5|nr:uncharacterized protein NEMAJ01_0311 [Nematocida major]KAH9385415.1 hypothetical protein NEMAJ01_0311 [Nematocida major]